MHVCKDQRASVGSLFLVVVLVSSIVVILILVLSLFLFLIALQIVIKARPIVWFRIMHAYDPSASEVGENEQSNEIIRDPK
jgi:hypothetical protein